MQDPHQLTAGKPPCIYNIVAYHDLLLYICGKLAKCRSRG